MMKYVRENYLIKKILKINKHFNNNKIYKTNNKISLKSVALTKNKSI